MKTHINLGLAAAAISMIVALGTGCDSTEPMVSNAAENTVAASDAPTFNEINRALSLDDADAAVVRAALAEWQHAATSQERNRFTMRRSEMDFVAAVAPSLDNDQLGKLVGLLVERRETQREARRERRGDGGNGERLQGLAEELGLSDEQIDAIEQMHEKNRAQMQELLEGRREGTITREQFREETARMRNERQAALAEILTPEQLQKMENMRTERWEQRQERRMEQRQERVERHAAWLDQALGLSDAQHEQVRAALAEHARAQNAIFESMASSTMPASRPHEQMSAAREELEATLENILTEQQRTRLELLQPLFPHRPGRG